MHQLFSYQSLACHLGEAIVRNSRLTIFSALDLAVGFQNGHIAFPNFEYASYLFS